MTDSKLKKLSKKILKVFHGRPITPQSILQSEPEVQALIEEFETLQKAAREKD